MPGFALVHPGTANGRTWVKQFIKWGESDQSGQACAQAELVDDDLSWIRVKLVKPGTCY